MFDFIVIIMLGLIACVALSVWFVSKKLNLISDRVKSLEQPRAPAAVTQRRAAVLDILELHFDKLLSSNDVPSDAEYSEAFEAMQETSKLFGHSVGDRVWDIKANTALSGGHGLVLRAADDGTPHASRHQQASRVWNILRPEMRAILKTETIRD